MRAALLNLFCTPSEVAMEKGKQDIGRGKNINKRKQTGQWAVHSLHVVSWSKGK